MARTAWRPTAKGELTRTQTLWFSAALGALGSVILWVWVNPLTMWLTFATFVGYAVIYTVILKPLTPQNIVIGGASGAMPPVLGWAAMRGAVEPEALMLCLIIFLWTPPHFWALALYRAEDYARAGLPMLPVTHGNDYTILEQSGTSASRTVVFAAGSATATVTVDPTADTTVESDETVALTLAAGSGYTIGTTTAVTGSITNDDVAIEVACGTSKSRADTCDKF